MSFPFQWREIQILQDFNLGLFENSRDASFERNPGSAVAIDRGRQTGHADSALPFVAEGVVDFAAHVHVRDPVESYVPVAGRHAPGSGLEAKVQMKKTFADQSTRV